jgi:membrane associated rhomboid family serine protease
MSQIPPATRVLIAICVAIYVAANVLAALPVGAFMLWPLGGNFAPWQLVSYAFLHGSFAHVFFNMFALFMFGSEMERLFGTRWFTLYFFVCVVTAGITQLVVNEILGSPYPTVGASGGVFGLLLAFAMYFPHRKLMLIFLPIPLPAWFFVTLYGAIELYLGVTQTASGIAHFAHLGGMVGGYLMIRQRRGSGRRRR